MPPIAIGELSERTGVKVPTIRYYEGIGLLPPPTRTSSNRRTYDASAVRRLHFIRHARELGFEVGSIRQLLALSDDLQASCKEVDDVARRHLADIESKIARLAALRDEVERMLRQCAKGRIAECRVVEVLSDHAECEHQRH